MNDYVSFLFSQSILLPLLIGLIRIRKIQSNYYPFLALIILGALTELVSFITIRLINNNAIVSNIWCLVECMLILYQFYLWRFYTKPRKWYWVIPAIYLLIWITENLIYGQIMVFGPVFRVSYAFLVVMLSINEINYLITHENRHLLKNARFLICMGFIIFFLYQILFEGSLFIVTANNIVVSEANKVISNKIISLAIYINVFVNIIFAIAMLFVPEKKQDFNRTMENLKDRHRQRSLN